VAADEGGVMDADQIARLVAARCPELDEAEISDVTERLLGAVVPMETFNAVALVIDTMQARLDDLEARLSRREGRNGLRIGAGVTADDDADVDAIYTSVRSIRVTPRRTDN
jgi:hypothetical protein